MGALLFLQNHFWISYKEIQGSKNLVIAFVIALHFKFKIFSQKLKTKNTFLNLHFPNIAEALVINLEIKIKEKWRNKTLKSTKFHRILYHYQKNALIPCFEFSSNWIINSFFWQKLWKFCLGMWKAVIYSLPNYFLLKVIALLIKQDRAKSQRVSFRNFSVEREITFPIFGLWNTCNVIVDYISSNWSNSMEFKSRANWGENCELDSFRRHSVFGLCSYWVEFATIH